MNQVCHRCGKQLLLLREGQPHYAWQCPSQCLPPLHTGVSISENIAPFESAAMRDGQVEFSIFTRPLSPELVPGAKTYMPEILHHFIECTRGACYNSIYL